MVNKKLAAKSKAEMFIKRVTNFIFSLFPSFKVDSIYVSNNQWYYNIIMNVTISWISLKLISLLDPRNIRIIFEFHKLLISKFQVWVILSEEA